MSAIFNEGTRAIIEGPPREYTIEKMNSDVIDRELGFQIDEIEVRVRAANTSDQQLWSHLSSQVFQTPYAEIWRILRDLGPLSGERVVDLGAGYGRMAFVLSAFFPEVDFLGYESSLERVEESQRVMVLHGLDPAKMIHQDLGEPEFVPARAQHYFIYDFGTRAAIEKALLDLKRLSSGGSIQVAARGRASRDAIERGHPWLSQVHPPRHFAHYSIYRS